MHIGSAARRFGAARVQNS